MANNERTIEKISKLAEKGKTSKVIPFLYEDEAEVVIYAIGALAPGAITDEESRNAVSHMLDDSRPTVRSAAAKALSTIGMEYSKTRLQYRYGVEQDPKVKADIMEAIQTINKKR